MEDIPNQLNLIQGTLVFSGTISMVGLAILIWMVIKLRVAIKPASSEFDSDEDS